ncbi:TauD/TfdA dioxygenase family protein [Dongia sp.]|uniref:TauD/TfdA dioxygenase family protein n=1 Tax=Dongia sp. TaxID=1977262 RepID=UPI0035B04AFB
MKAVSETASGIRVRRLAGRIGAELSNIKLTGGLSRQQVEEIRQALLANRVIFFRDQNDFSDVDQEAFANMLGGLVPHPTEQVRQGSAGILELDAAAGNGKADVWHTDVTFVDAYPRYSVLRAMRIPEVGGDTLWANTVAAYDDLSPQLKALAESLWAVHSNKYDYAAQHAAATPEEAAHYEKVFASQVYEAEHPVVRIHPETGEKTLVLGYFIQRFVGHNHIDSNLLFTLLQNHVIRMENIVRWNWRVGDVAIWDNQATQHYAMNDYGKENRTMRRVTIAGEVPVSVDGRYSRMLKAPLKAAE